MMPFTARELRELLEICNRNNRQRDLTGMLLYKDGGVTQVLEGAETTVRMVHETICRDPRHRGLVTLLEDSAPGRQFPDWSMGFKDLGADVDSPEGYSEFLNLPLTDRGFKADPTRAQKLLLAFKKRPLI